MEELKPLEELLQVPLNTDNPTVLAMQLADVEGHQFRLSQIFRDKKAQLADERNRNYPAKDKDMFSSSEARQIYMEANTASLQAEVDKLRDMAEIIERRISLGQTFLAMHRQELKSMVGVK